MLIRVHLTIFPKVDWCNYTSIWEKPYQRARWSSFSQNSCQKSLVLSTFRITLLDSYKKQQITTMSCKTRKVTTRFIVRFFLQTRKNRSKIVAHWTQIWQGMIVQAMELDSKKSKFDRGTMLWTLFQHSLWTTCCNSCCQLCGKLPLHTRKGDLWLLVEGSSRIIS